MLTKPAQVALVGNESCCSLGRPHFNEEFLDGVIDRSVVKLALSRLILLKFSCKGFTFSRSGIPGFSGSNCGNFASTFAALRIGPIEIELGTRALPVHRFPGDDDPLRVRLAILAACYGKELPPPGVLAILGEADLPGRLAVGSLSICSTFVIPRGPDC